MVVEQTESLLIGLSIGDAEPFAFIYINFSIPFFSEERTVQLTKCQFEVV
jgi:hypothetical protein